MPDSDPLSGGGLVVLDNYSTDTEYARQTTPFYDAHAEHNQWLDKAGLPRGLAMPRTTFPSLDLPDPNAPASEFVAAYHHNNAWLSYLLSLEAKVNSEKLAVENVIDITKAQLRADLRNSSDSRVKRGGHGSLSADDIQARILTNPRYQDALLRQQKVLMRLADLRALSSALNKNIQSLSRVITLRGQDLYFGPAGNKAPPNNPRSSRRSDRGSPDLDDEM